MEFDKKSLLKLGKLARISISDDKLNNLSKDLNSILEFVDQLKEIKTDQVDPTSNSLNQELELRDDKVMTTESGIAFMTIFNQFYYSFSPAVADYERENPVFKEAVKVTLTPMLTSLTLLNYVDVDSEQEILGYGIGIILLNIGMYFVAPAAAIIAIKNRIKRN